MFSFCSATSVITYQVTAGNIFRTKRESVSKTCHLGSTTKFSKKMETIVRLSAFKTKEVEIRCCMPKDIEIPK